MGAKLGSILRYSRHFKLSHLISIFIFIFALLAGVVLWKYDFDDSFIIYRIAENVVNNKGWTFNPGERINGSTSFLWTALQIVGSLIIRNAQHFAHMMTPLALFFNGMLFWILFRKLVSNGIAIMTALFFMSFPLLLRSWGLETQLYLTLALASIYAECCGRSLMLGLALGGLILTRPDGILLAIILLLNRLIFKKRTPWLPTIMIAGLIIPWLIFSYTYFGAFFPNTLAAKMAQARSGLWNFSFSWPFSEFPLFIQGFYYWLRTIYMFDGLYINLAATISIALFLIAGLFSWRYWGKVGGIIILWAIIHIIGYSLINVPEYPWYYAPAILAICFLIGFGLKFLLDKTKSTGKRKIAASIIVLFYCSLLSINIFHIYRQTQKSALLNRRIAAYLQVGDWIKKNTSSSIKIAAVEIGGLGYSSKRNIIDMAGLVDAEGPRYISRRELDWWLRIHEPDLVLTHIPSWPIERPIEEDMRYELWRVFAYPGCETLQLFRLKSLNIKCPY